MAVHTLESAVATGLLTLPLLAEISPSAKSSGGWVKVKVRVAVSPILRRLLLLLMLTCGAELARRVLSEKLIVLLESPPSTLMLPARSVKRPLASVTVAPPTKSIGGV